MYATKFIIQYALKYLYAEQHDTSSGKITQSTDMSILSVITTNRKGQQNFRLNLTHLIIFCSKTLCTSGHGLDNLLWAC